MALVINDDNWENAIRDLSGDDHGTGYIRRDRSLWPVASAPRSKAFDIPLIPRSEWSARIAEMEKNQSNLRHILERHRIASLNQRSTNYCWTFGVVTAITAIRAAANQPYVDLSPASVAAPIKNYRNYGGWGGEALEYIIENGICSTEYWPATAIERRYDNEDSRANRKHHLVTEWYDIDCGDDSCFDAVMTCVLLNLPVAVGYNWWSHEVCAIYPVDKGNGKYALGCRNSWGDDYGDHGFFELEGRRAIPSDAVVPIVFTGAVS